MDAERGVVCFDEGSEEGLVVGSHGNEVVEAGELRGAVLRDEESEGVGIGGEESVR